MTKHFMIGKGATMSGRDPRKHPRPGDIVLAPWGLKYCVTQVDREGVLFRREDGTRVKRAMPLRVWQEQCRDDSVVAVTNDPHGEDQP